MRVHAKLGAIGVGAAVWSASGTALAHDAPRVIALLERALPGQVTPSALLVTNRGFIFGEPAARNYRLLCNEALGINTAEEPSAAFLPDGSLIVATSVGLQRTRDEGCTLEGVAPLGVFNTPALVQHPSDPARLFVAVYDQAQGGIHRTTDGANSFARVHVSADTQFLEELLVSPGAPETLYACGFDFSFEGPERTHVLLRSQDGGDSFERFEIPLLDNEADVMLLAVSPSDPNLLLARTLDSGTTTRLDRLLVSRDGGQSWQSVLQAHQLFGAGFVAGAVWATGIDGLYRSTDDAASFEHIDGPTHMAGVGQLYGTPLVSGRFAPGRNGLAQVMSGSSELSPWLDFYEVRDPVDCSDGTLTHAICAPLYDDWVREIVAPVDAGAPDGGGSDGAITSPDASSTDASAVDAGDVDAGDVDAEIGDSAVAPVQGTGSRSSGCATAGTAEPGASYTSTHAAFATWVLTALVRRRRNRMRLR